MNAQQTDSGGIKRGDVRGVRELKHGVQAQVALGYVPGHGVASATIVSHSLEVLQAMADLKRLLANEAFIIVGVTEEAAGA